MANEELKRRFEFALNSHSPLQALYDLAIALKAEGMDQIRMYRLFSTYQQELSGDDPRYDAVADNMDCIWGGGWAKGRDLFEKELTESEITRTKNS